MYWGFWRHFRFQVSLPSNFGAGFCFVYIFTDYFEYSQNFWIQKAATTIVNLRGWMINSWENRVALRLFAHVFRNLYEIFFYHSTKESMGNTRVNTIRFTCNRVQLKKVELIAKGNIVD